MLGIKPHISFQGNCAEAIDFYVHALHAKILFSQTYGDSPMKGDAPDAYILHCTLQIGESYLMTCDRVGSGEAVAKENPVSLMIGTNELEVAESMFGRLSEGATIRMPLQKTFWAVRFGILRDKYGIEWIFNVNQTQGAPVPN